MGYAALRVRYFRFQYNRYYEKYAEVYTDYKKIKAELDTIKKTIKPNGGRGGWFNKEEFGEPPKNGGMGIHPDNIHAE